jgi:NAD-dependent DNA ligase
VPAGWSSESLNELVKALGEYADWRAKETPKIPYPLLPVGGVVKAAPVAQKGSICFTGVRSKELEANLEAAGWKIVDSVSSKTSVLVVPDGPLDSTGKVKKAQDLGTVRILEISKVSTAAGIF